MGTWLSRYFYSLFSLLLLALLFLCIRDFHHEEQWEFEDIGVSGAHPEVRNYRLAVDRGKIEMYWEVCPGTDDQTLTQSLAKFRLGHPRAFHSSDPFMAQFERESSPDLPPRSFHYRNPARPMGHSVFGIQTNVLGWGMDKGTANVQGPFSYGSFVFPMWPLGVFFLIPLARMTYVVHRRRRAVRHGLCQSCGYDLRASRGICPECGVAPFAAPRSSKLAQITPLIFALLSMIGVIVSVAFSLRCMERRLQAHWYPYNITTDFLAAISEKNIGEARHALDTGANVQGRPFCLPSGTMGAAIRTENPEFVNLLIEHGFSLAGDKESYALLPLEDARLLEILLHCGANPNPWLPSDDTMLINAVLQGNTEAVRLLLNAGADMNFKDRSGQTVLHESFEPDQAKDAAILTLLLACHPKLDVPDIYGDTPLHSAARVGNLARMGRLAEAGANVNSRNKEGKTALELINDDDRPKAAEILRKAIPTSPGQGRR
ncbi:MAG TPA: ankyrin repeat domain-containing protein [Humisphaera sp.]|nr:ankyrin repeat domain-containing protein [Humisphaera sp.]